MRPIARETIVDRRQPALRWSAVFAGATVAVALWVVLQLIGMGGGLAALELDDSGSLRSIGVGTTVWSMLAPLVALFVGGLVAGRLATTFDRKVGAAHGFVAWAIASIAGVIAMAWLVSALAAGAMHAAYGQMPTSDSVLVDPGLRAEEVAAATERTGKILLGAGITLLLSLGAALGGGAVAARRYTRPRRNTQEVPVVPPPDEPPADAPHVGAP
jgi:MFS family permease